MSEDQISDPAKAFDDLRAEVSVLRKAVEAFPAAIRDSRPPDYAPDLAILGKGLDEIGAQLDAITKSPALRQTPEQQGQAIANAGGVMLREASQKLDRAVQEADRERYNLAQMVGTLGTKAQQRRFWTILLPLVFVLGLMAFPFVIRVVPGGFKRSTVAVIMDESQWNAGMALMQSGNPDGWDQLRADAELVSANRAKITECRHMATKTRKDERCIITVR